MTLILPPSSLGTSTAVVPVIGIGGIPSSRPPAVTTGPIIVALLIDDCPASSTQTAANQYGTPPSNCKAVVLPVLQWNSNGSESPTTLVISCCTAQILTLSGSSSVQAAHSRKMVPAAPPDAGFAVIQAGAAGTSSVGVIFCGYVIGTPNDPSAYSITTAARYWRSSRNSSVTPALSALVMVAFVRDQNPDLM